MPYKNILVAVGLGETSASVLKKADQLAKIQDAKLHVLHALEPLSITYGGDIPLDFYSVQEKIQQEANDQLNDFCDSHTIPKSNRHLAVGHPAVEIAAMAKKLDVDLIVVGSHARFGIALLLGSTVDNVLHSVECDVLAVRVTNPD